MFWKSKKFKALQSEWYDVLILDGFNDIERNEELKQNAPNSYRQADQVSREAKLEYFLMLSHKFKEHAHEFEDNIDYFVMAKFSLGFSNAQIREKLSALGHSRDKRTIRYIRRKYEHKWGICNWKPDEMRSQKKKV